MVSMAGGVSVPLDPEGHMPATISRRMEESKLCNQLTARYDSTVTTDLSYLYGLLL